ncbi:MAG: ferritin-like domain-containing protein [bacterium]|nr:ferritin-like domain-containing protein [bacterium]
MSSKKSHNSDSGKALVLKKLVESLTLEINAIAQYHSFAINCKPVDFRSAKVAELFQHLAADETGDLKIFIEWINNLGGTVDESLPVKMELVTDPVKMLKMAIEMEKGAVRKYREVLKALKTIEEEEFYSEGLFHAIIHIITDEQEHIRKCELLLD